MCICLNKIVMGLCLIVLLQTVATGHTTHLCENAQFIVSKFVNSKKNEDWDTVEAKVYSLESCKCEMAPVLYYLYRMKVLLPNSHSLQGISPNDFIASQKVKMCEQIKILRSCDSRLYMPLITTMIKQHFDSEIAQSASDLNKKLKSKREF